MGCKAVAHAGSRRYGAAWPVTSVADTVIDLAATLAADDLARAWHEAGIRHRAKPTQVESRLPSGRTRPARATCEPCCEAAHP